MVKRTFYFLALCLFVGSCNAHETSKKNVDIDIKEDLKIYLLTQYDDIKISEIYSKNSSKKDYLKKSLGDALSKEALDVKARDIYFKELSAKSETHLGIVYLHYSSTEQAKKAISQVQHKGFFENTKILTKYVVVNADEINLIIYTESAADKTVLHYMDSISNKVLTNGHNR